MFEKFTDANFEEMVVKSTNLLLLTFLPNGAALAGWCHPSFMNLLLNMKARIVAGELNVDENPDTTARFKVRNIPTVLFIKGGEVVDKQVGAVPKATYKAMIEKYLKRNRRLRN